MMKLMNRFPSLKQLLSVYAVTVFIIYGWSLIRFSWRLPSFLTYMTLDDIGVVFSYLIMVNFFETFTVMVLPITLGFILPEKWFLKGFVTKSTLLVVMGLGYMIHMANQINPEAPFPYALFKLIPFVLLASTGLSLALGQIAMLAKIIDDLADRFVIFLYISTPVSVVALLVVLFRNIV